MKATTTKDSTMIVGRPMRSYCFVSICHPTALWARSTRGLCAIPQRLQGTSPIEQHRPVGSYSVRTAAINHARQLTKTPTHEENATRVSGGHHMPVICLPSSFL